MDYSLAPDILTITEVKTAIFPFTDAAAGLGLYLATLPKENGWDQSSFFDHPASDVICHAAIQAARDWAKSNQRFYNNEKLEDAVTQELIVAYVNAFVS